MKVFDLRCRHSHRFEGWFASEQDFLDQQARRLVTCPLCNDGEVERVPSAARLNLASLREAPRAAAHGTPEAAGAAAPGAAANAEATVEMMSTMGVDLQALWMQAVKHVLANTEDVGDRFAAEARDIHYGRTGHRGIRGQATPDEAAELREEGIEVQSMPVPAALKGPLQ
jgi:hypothetical protein